MQDKTIGITLDQKKLKHLLTDNLYKNESTCIREIVSNAIDAKRRSGTNKPVFVIYKNLGYGCKFSVRDYGVGMTPEEFEEKICVLGNSDKDWNKNNESKEIGKFGVGSLAFRSLTNECTWICYKDGKKFKGVVWEKEDELFYDIGMEEETNEENGVEVILSVPQKYSSSFLTWVRQELAYFPDIFWDVNNDLSWNTKKVLESEDFKISELSVYNELHILLDNIVYPVDWNKLQLNPIRLNIGLKFSLSDGLEPSLTRESLKYSSDFKIAFGKKLRKVADWFVERYNSDTRKEFEGAHIGKVVESIRRNPIVKIDGMDFHIKELAPFANVYIEYPSYPGISHVLLKKLDACTHALCDGWEGVKLISGGRVRKSEIMLVPFISSIALHSYSNGYKIFTIDEGEKVSGKMMDYLRETYRNALIVKRTTKKYKLGKYSDWRKKYDNYYHLLKLNQEERSNWRKLITEFQVAQKAVERDFIPLSSITMSEGFLERWKASRKRKGKLVSKDEGQIVLKYAQDLERSSGAPCKFVPIPVNISDLHKLNKLHVYGIEKDKEELGKIFSYIRGIKVCIVNQRDLKYIKDKQNFMEFSDFNKGGNQPFRRFCVALLIQDLWKENSAVVRHANFIKGLSLDFYNKLTALEGYRFKYASNSVPEEVKENMLEIFEAHGWYTEMYYIYKEVKEKIKLFDFLGVLERPKVGKYGSVTSERYVPDECFELAKEILKNRKVRYDVHLSLEGEVKVEIPESKEEKEEVEF